MALVTKTQLENAASDASTLESFVNGAASPGTITTRTGQSLKTLARIQSDVLAAAAIPIWANISGLAAGGTQGSAGVVGSSGGVTVQKLGTGSYRVFHASFTTNTRVMLTVFGASQAGVCLEQRSVSTAGYIELVAFTSAGVAADVMFNLMTFPQML